MSVSQSQASISIFAHVRQQMNQLFSLDEIRSLSFDLGIDYENLEGTTRDGKIISLLIYTTQHKKLSALEKRLTELRPFVEWEFPPPQYLSADLQIDRNRQNFLNNLKTSWIDGFLHQSLHSEVIKLTITNASGNTLARETKRRNWHMVKQKPGQEDEPLALDKPVGEIFNECGRGLLILGDPGSGKTITLLQLAEDLVAEATLLSQPMPVVLNLSSWAQEKQELIEWLVAEIFIQYGVSRDLARRWIESNSLIYLLDGLDEVAIEARDDCVTAINEFRATQLGTVEMVVCSRVVDYKVLSQKLNLNTAIQIQPLSEVQVDNYLNQSDLEMLAVRMLLKSDPPMRELAQSPLMLNVMMMAYVNKSVNELKSFDTVTARRQHLFDTYIDAMFAHRPLTAEYAYSDIEARHWLMEIAYALRECQISEFYIEKLQLCWLPTGNPRRYYPTFSGLFIRSIVGLSVGLSVGLIAGILVGLLTGLLVGLVFCLLGGFLGALLGGLLVRFNEDNWKIESIEVLRRRRPTKLELFNKILISFNLGSGIGILFGVSIALIFGLFVYLIFQTAYVPLQAKFWSPMAIILLFGGAVGLLIGAVVGVLLGMVKASFTVQEIHERTQPNQGIIASRQNALRMGSVLGLVFGSIFGLSIGILVGSVLNVRDGLIFGLTFGLSIGLSIGLNFGILEYGGKAFIQHFILRYLLSRQNILPYPFSDKKLVAYLDAMVERILLRRTGGGYIFIHRSLMEHLAAKHLGYIERGDA